MKYKVGDLILSPEKAGYLDVGLIVKIEKEGRISWVSWNGGPPLREVTRFLAKSIERNWRHIPASADK